MSRPAANRRQSAIDMILRPGHESDEEDDNLTDEQRRRRQCIRTILLIVKMFLLLVLWLMFCIFIIMRPPDVESPKMVIVPAGGTIEEKVPDSEGQPLIGVTLEGPIDVELLNAIPQNINESIAYIDVRVERVSSDGNVVEKSRNMSFYINDKSSAVEHVEHTFQLAGADKGSARVIFTSTHPKDTPLRVIVDSTPMDTTKGVIFALCILIGLYVLIIWDIVDRTFAALLASTASIGVLAYLDERPSLEQIIRWIDVTTIMLLFGMMILVAILAETGVFDYLAVYAYKMASGHPWPLIFFLCMFTGGLSAFLDNVTMVLLMTPVTIRLCEVMYLKTTSVLVCVVIFSNLGGTLTPVGDPPNVIIASNKYIVQSGIDFLTFTLHMFPGVILSFIACFLYLRFVLSKKLSTVDEDAAMRHSIKAWRQQAAKVQPTTASEDVMRQDILERVNQLKEQYRKKKDDKSFGLKPVPNFIETLVDLESRYYIRNKPLLVKSTIALVFVVLLFFLHTLPFMQGVTLPWAAMLAALLLLILANKEDMQVVLVHVEWSTLLFFAALFVLMEALSEMGLIEFVGEQTTKVILSVSKSSRVMVSILLMLWISALTSAFVDNIPITTMMIKLTITLAKNEELDLPLQPLVWALAFGACFGGNGTLIGASANVVCAGIAGQHGYKFTFVDFLKIGFPVMILSVVVATIYLLFSHVLLSWH